MEMPRSKVFFEEEIRRGQNQIVQSLLLHPHASLFTFHREEALLNNETKDSKELHVANPDNKEEAGKNKVIKEDPASSSETKKNLVEEKTSPTLLFASGTFTKLLGPSIPRRKDSFTGESILSFSSSLPSSLTTDPPPTPLSVSSYGSMEKPTVPLENLDISCLPPCPCQVSVRPLVLKAFPTSPIPEKSIEEDHGYSISSPEPDTITRKGLLDGVHVTTKQDQQHQDGASEGQNGEIQHHRNDDPRRQHGR